MTPASATCRALLAAGLTTAGLGTSLWGLNAQAQPQAQPTEVRIGFQKGAADLLHRLAPAADLPGVRGGVAGQVMLQARRECGMCARQAGPGGGTAVRRGLDDLDHRAVRGLGQTGQVAVPDVVLGRVVLVDGTFERSRGSAKAAFRLC